MSDDLWIFGYGSLVWRPAFAYEERRTGWIEGWTRRFWQGSTDHRGIPGAPGRVVTLIPHSGARCWGVAYRVAVAAAAEVMAALDVREQGGYARHTVDVCSDRGLPIPDALVYVATADNPNFLGEAPMAAIAEQVLRSSGPSGHNVEYVVRLAEALRVMKADDPHVFELESLVMARRASWK